MNKKYYKQFIYKITLNGSETIVTPKFPLQYVREQTPPNQDQKPRTRGNNVFISSWYTLIDIFTVCVFTKSPFNYLSVIVQYATTPWGQTTPYVALKMVRQWFRWWIGTD